MPASDDRRVFGVAQLNAWIAGVVGAQLSSEVWVAGEVARLNERNGTRYFDLVEHADGRTAAQMPCTVLRWERGGFDRDLAAVPGFNLAAGTQVLVRGRLTFYQPWGKLQLQVVGIDPAHTLGRMRLERERLLAALRTRGVLRANASRPVVAVPLRIGLVTSRGSRAEADVLERLRGSGYAFEVVRAHTSVQGPRCEPEVVAGLAQLSALHERRPLDVVLVVRGGGGPTELAGFDTAGIAEAIVTAPMAVWTGIGHEGDTSVADAVAHTAFATPTAAAEGVIAQVDAYDRRIEEAAGRLGDGAQRRLHRERDRLNADAEALRAAARVPLQLAAARLAAAGQRLPSAARGRLLRERERTARAVRVLGGRTARARVVGEQQRLAGLRTALAREPAVIVERRRGRLDVAAARLAGLDPQAQLRRGFALVYGEDGRTVRSVGDLEVGDDLRVRLADGTVDARVTGADPASAVPPRLPRDDRRERHDDGGA